MTDPRIATFSIAATDGTDWGVAVASKFLAVGSAVPAAEAELGAIATQAMANTSYRPKGLELLRGGASAEEVVRQLTQADPERDHRQLGVVDRQGRAATYTGSSCLDWAGGRTGAGCACQGNILAGAGVVDAVLETFESSRGELARRLMEALAAGDAAGGDRRGRQSAALLVVRAGAGYGGFDDRMIDLRVDDHPRPIAELGRVLSIWRLHFAKTAPEEMLAPEGPVLERMRAALQTRGLLAPGASEGQLWEAYLQWASVQNLEERCRVREQVDPVVLEFLESSRSDQTP